MTEHKLSDAFDRAVNCKHSSTLQSHLDNGNIYVECEIYPKLIRPVESCKSCKYYEDERI